MGNFKFQPHINP